MLEVLVYFIQKQFSSVSLICGRLVTEVTNPPLDMLMFVKMSTLCNPTKSVDERLDKGKVSGPCFLIRPFMFIRCVQNSPAFLF